VHPRWRFCSSIRCPPPERQHTVAASTEAVGVHRTTVYDYLRKES